MLVRSSRPSERKLRAYVPAAINSGASDAQLMYEAEYVQVTASNFRLQANSRQGDLGTTYFALVLVSDGDAPNALGNFNAAGNYYEPTQNVILSGVLDPQSVNYFSSNYSRKMRKGDALWLLTANVELAAPGNQSLPSYSLQFTITN